MKFGVILGQKGGQGICSDKTFVFFNANSTEMLLMHHLNPFICDIRCFLGFKNYCSTMKFFPFGVIVGVRKFWPTYSQSIKQKLLFVMSIKLSFIYKKPHSKISFTEIIKSCNPALPLFYRGFRVPSPCILVVRGCRLEKPGKHFVTFKKISHFCPTVFPG